MNTFIKLSVLIFIIILQSSTLSLAQISVEDASSFFHDHKPQKADKIIINGLLIRTFNPHTTKIRALQSSIHIKDKSNGRDIYLPYSLIRYLSFDPGTKGDLSKRKIIISVLNCPVAN